MLSAYVGIGNPLLPFLKHGSFVGNINVLIGLAGHLSELLVRFLMNCYALDMSTILWGFGPNKW